MEEIYDRNEFLSKSPSYRFVYYFSETYNEAKDVEVCLGVLMREKFNHLYLDSHERKLLIHSLVELKNQLIQQGRYTDCVDELIFKVINAPTKRMKIEYV